METYPMQLPVALSRDAAEQLNDRLLTLLVVGDDIKARRKEAMAGFRKEEAELNKQMATVRASLTSKTELREVMVKEVPDHATGKVAIHRTDVPKNAPNRVVEIRDLNLFDQASGAEEGDQIDADEAAALADAAAAEAEEGSGKRKRAQSSNGEDKTERRGRKRVTASH